MNGPARFYGTRKRTKADCHRAADALFLNARDLSRITVETLVHSYGFKPHEAEERLARERARRA